MVLNSETAAQLTSEQIQLVERIEKEIDDWLSRKYSGDKEAKQHFDFSDASKLASEKVVRELSDRYRKAGWGRVEITYGTGSDNMYVNVTFAK